MTEMKIPIIIYCAVTTICSCKPPKNIVDNWIRICSDTSSYIINVDSQIIHQGSQTMWIRSKNTECIGYSVLFRAMSAKKYRGKRIRFSGYLKTKNVVDWAGFFLRVDAANPFKTLALDNMKDRPIKGTADWKEYDIVLDVGDDADTLKYGTILSKSGEIWFSKIAINIVDNDVPLTEPVINYDTLKVSNYITQNYLDSTRTLTAGSSFHNAAYLTLNHNLPLLDSIEWAYGEINVPKGEAPTNTYYCILGGNYFYSGIQVNSATERRIIFSVWDAQGGHNDRNVAPDSTRATILYARKDLVTNRFGNEGSGIHTHLIFDWKDGITYKFLLHSEPNFNENSTIYTFFVQINNNWERLAKIKTPKFSSYINYLYSFLENFGRNDDLNRRSASYQNIWVRRRNGDWHEITTAKYYIPFGDGNRKTKDYGCGLSTEKGFMLSSGGGFTDTYIPPNSIVERPPIGKFPMLKMPDL